jgi:hypothetical protein
MSFIAVATIGVSVGTSVVAGVSAKNEAKKQKELQTSIFLTDVALKEKLATEELKLLGETQRTQILANSLKDYRVALQQEGTKRLKDTWIYVAGSGLGISLVYGITLVAKSYENK